MKDYEFEQGKDEDESGIFYYIAMGFGRMITCAIFLSNITKRLFRGGFRWHGK